MGPPWTGGAGQLATGATLGIGAIEASGDPMGIIEAAGLAHGSKVGSGAIEEAGIDATGAMEVVGAIEATGAMEVVGAIDASGVAHGSKLTTGGIDDVGMLEAGLWARAGLSAARLSAAVATANRPAAGRDRRMG